MGPLFLCWRFSTDNAEQHCNAIVRFIWSADVVCSPRDGYRNWISRLSSIDVCGICMTLYNCSRNHCKLFCRHVSRDPCHGLQCDVVASLEPRVSRPNIRTRAHYFTSLLLLAATFAPRRSDLRIVVRERKRKRTGRGDGGRQPNLAQSRISFRLLQEDHVARPKQ